jgi:anti-sigma factor ChrR (cupin superfamily)
MHDSDTTDELLLLTLTGELTAESVAAQDAPTRAALARLSTIVDVLALAPEPVTPRQELEAEILERARDRAPGKRRIGPEDGQWVEQWPGILVKPLYAASGGYHSYLLRMTPGSVLPAHTHRGAEEFFMMDGDGAFEGFSLARGDYFRSDSGTDHGALTTRAGCTILLMAHGPIDY